SNVTGTIMPVQDLGILCKKKGILFMVDGAQGAGHMPTDVKNIDLLAVPGHKGLLGPLGTGMLYVREGVSLRPLMEGGTGTVSRDIKQPAELPEGFETGTINAPGIIGLGYSAGLVNKIGVDIIRQHQLELTRILDSSLRN
ncbi:aminotransferase class V-fold PLP-dependent enzyme, partial [Intestinibacillus massiliensis]|nr:aminotransferase class V-fold PLP-dependent enzyme [Intestinibacillus massiliensis]